MKRLIFLVSIFVSVSLIADKELLKYVPESADGIISINLREAINHQKIKEYLEGKNADVKLIEFKNTLDNHGIDIYNAVSSGLLFFSITEKSGSALIKTSIEEETFKKLIKDESQKNEKPFNTELVDGKTLYSFTEDESDSAGNIPKTSFASYISHDVIAFSQNRDEIINLFPREKKGNVKNNRLEQQADRIDTESLIWGMFDMPVKQEKKRNTVMPLQNTEVLMNPFDSIAGGNFYVKLMGKDKKDIKLNFCLECGKQENAQMLSMQMNAFIMLLCSQVFQNAPLLGNTVVNAIKLNVENRNVTISANISEELQEKIRGFIESQKEKFISAGPQKHDNAEDQFLPAPPTESLKSKKITP